MRILDNDTKQPLLNVTIYLTVAEAAEMVGDLKRLLADPEQHHTHQNDEGFVREITLAVYTDQNILEFDIASRRLIERPD